MPDRKDDITKPRFSTEGVTTEPAEELPEEEPSPKDEPAAEHGFDEDTKTEESPMVPSEEYVLVSKGKGKPNVASEPTRKVDHEELVRKLREKATKK